MVALGRVLRYNVGTIDYDCYYWSGSSEAKLVGFSDSDHVGNIKSSHNTLGVLFFPWVAQATCCGYVIM
jgi:hypothetical protein